MTWFLDRNELTLAQCDAACFTALKARVQPELDKWALWIRLNFTEAASLAQADIRIQFIQNGMAPGGADAWSARGLTGVAPNQTLDWGVIRVNPVVHPNFGAWNAAAGLNDFAYLVLHETGHILGMGDLYRIDHNGGAAGGTFEGEDFCDHGLPSGPAPAGGPGLEDTRTKADNVMQARGQMVLDNDTIHGAEWLWGCSGSLAIVTGELSTRQAGYNANEAAVHHGLKQTTMTWTYRGSTASFGGASKVTLYFKGILAARDVGPGTWTATLFPDRVEFDSAGAWEGNFKFEIDCDQEPERYGNATVAGAVSTQFTATPAGGGRQTFPFDQIFGADCEDIEIDYFPESSAKVEIRSPLGTDIVKLTGPSTVHVDLSSLGDADLDGREEVPTQMVQLDLSGYSPLFGVVTLGLNPDLAMATVGEIEEKENKTPGVLDLPPFTGEGTADSFFDVYFEITVGGEVLHNRAQDPKRVETEITEKPPAPGDTYESPTVIPLYDSNDLYSGVDLVATRHTPEPKEIDFFPETEAKIELSTPLGYDIVTLTGPSTVEVDLGSIGDEDWDGREEVPIELVQLELSGVSPILGPVTMRLNPDLPTYGEIEEKDNKTPNLLDLPPFTAEGTADSYMDVYFVVEVGGETLHNKPEDPKRMETEITEKPPGEGDTYESPVTIPLFDGNDQYTGVDLLSTRHTPRPKETDYFPESKAVVEIRTPDGTYEVTLVGPTTVEVDLGSLADTDGNGREQVETEMVSMDLTGNHADLGPIRLTVNPGAPTYGEIEEVSNDTPGVLDIPPFTETGSGDSFFDVFFRIEIGGEILHNNDPKHMETVIAEKPPREGDKYENPDTIELFDENNDYTGIDLVSVSHTPRPKETDYFPETKAKVEISIPGWGTDTVTLTGPSTVIVDLGSLQEAGDGRDLVPTEMVQLDLTGVSTILGSVVVRLNPDQPTYGEIKETVNNTPGVLDLPPFTDTGEADSFFDVYFEIQVAGLILHNELTDPKHIETTITEKPPADGETYESPISIPLFDQGGLYVGDLVSTRHTPRPIEIDYFPKTKAKVEITSPLGDDIITLIGPSTVEVDLGSLGDDDGNLREEVKTQMVELDLVGFSPLFGPVKLRLSQETATTGEIEETANNTDGVLDIPPFTETGSAESFFDVFFEVNVGGEWLHNVDPKRVETTITEKPPAEGETYENPDTIPLFHADGSYSGVDMTSTFHTPRPIPPRPPDPHLTVPGLGQTSTTFGGDFLESPPIPAGFFGPGSDPFEGQIEFEGTPVDPDTYGDASTVIERSADPIQPSEPVGTTGTIETEIVALSLRSIEPITVEYNEGQDPAEQWDVEVTLSQIPAGMGQLTATKTHDNGGVFSMNLPVNPKLTFIKVGDPTEPGPPEIKVLNGAMRGRPPINISIIGENAPWVHSVDPSLGVVAPSDGTFVPGVQESPLPLAYKLGKRAADRSSTFEFPRTDISAALKAAGMMPPVDLQIEAKRKRSMPATAKAHRADPDDGGLRAPAEPGSDTCPATDEGVLPSAGGTVNGNTTGMADDFGHSGVTDGTESCSGWGTSIAGDAIHAFQVDASGLWEFTTCGLGWDTNLMILEELGSGCPGDGIVGCNGDDGTSCNADPNFAYESTVWAYLCAGHTYYLLVDGWADGHEGPYGVAYSRVADWDCTECPAQSLYSQPVQLFGSAGTSDAALNLLRYESFAGVAEPICDIHWWGMARFYGTAWSECFENPMPFEVRFYENDGGQPGAEVCSYAGVLTGTEAADLGTAIYEYSVDLDPCCTMPANDGWVSIQGGGDPNCWFLWMNSAVGDDSNCLLDGTGILTCGPPDHDYDLSFCLTGGDVGPTVQTVVPVTLGDLLTDTWHTVTLPTAAPQGPCEGQPAGTVCRLAAGDCDAEEVCDGVNPDCPPDVMAPWGTDCGDLSDSECDHPDSCDGAGYCQDNFEADGTECEDDGLPCTLGYCEFGLCNQIILDPGTPCPDDGDPCTWDICDEGGLCTHPPAPNGESCEDGDACTFADVCIDGACWGIDIGTVECTSDADCPIGTCSTETYLCECEPSLAVNPPLPGLAPYDFRKNRYIAFRANNPGPVVIRVQVAELVCDMTGDPCSFDADCPNFLDGEVCLTPEGNDPSSFAAEPEWEHIGWLGQPCVITPTPQVPANTRHSMVVSWMPALPGFVYPPETVFAGDCEIMPRWSIGLSASNDGVNFSDRLVLGTIRRPYNNDKNWADVVGARDPGTGEYTEPNQRINVDDVQVMIVFLNNKSYRPHVTVLDLSPEVPNYKINADDLQMVLRAFSLTEDYPPLKFQVEDSGATQPGDCPADPPGTKHDKCQEETAYGACCTDDVCFDMTPADCDAVAGTYLGDGTPCDADKCKPQCDNCHTISATLWECFHWANDKNGVACKTDECIENVLDSATCDFHKDRTGTPDCDTDVATGGEVIQRGFTAPCPGGNVNWVTWKTLWSGCDKKCVKNSYLKSCETEPCDKTNPAWGPDNRGKKKKCGC